MAVIPNLTIAAPKRVPFDDSIYRMGSDYSGATPRMEVRQLKGDSSTPIFALDASTSGGQGIVVTYDADYVDPDGLMPNGATQVRIIINETTLEGVDYNTPSDQPLVLYYDIHLTPAGGKKFVFCEGQFVIYPGVTQ